MLSRRQLRRLTRAQGDGDLYLASLAQNCQYDLLARLMFLHLVYKCSSRVDRLAIDGHDNVGGARVVPFLIVGERPARYSTTDGFPPLQASLFGRAAFVDLHDLQALVNLLNRHDSDISPHDFPM